MAINKNLVRVSDTNLNATQLQTVAMLSTGTSITETGKALSVSKNTIYNWLDNADFRQALNRTVEKNVTLLMLEGLGELSDIMHNSLNPVHKLEAFKILAKMTDFYTDKVKVSIEDKTKQNYQLDELMTEINKTF